MPIYKSGSTGETLDLSGKNLKAHLRTSDLYDYEWEMERRRRKLGLGTRVTAFAKKQAEHTLVTDLIGNKQEEKKRQTVYLKLQREILLKRKQESYI